MIVSFGNRLAEDTNNRLLTIRSQTFGGARHWSAVGLRVETSGQRMDQKKFLERTAGRMSSGLEQALERRFGRGIDRIVVAHGELMEAGGREAYAFLG